MNTALEYSTRVVQEGGRRCKKSTLNDLVHLTPLRIPLMNPPYVWECTIELIVNLHKPSLSYIHKVQWPVLHSSILFVNSLLTNMKYKHGLPCTAFQFSLSILYCLLCQSSSNAYCVNLHLLLPYTLPLNSSFTDGHFSQGTNTQL